MKAAMTPRNQPRPIEIQGVLYPSLKAAAEAFNVTPDAVRQAEKRGRLDTLGIGRGHSRVPISFQGKEYPSIYQAAKETGISKSTLWSALENGNLETVGTGQRRPRKKNGKK